ncbi:MAG: ParB/RepB/Spo0J family partition protein [Oscillospiraceae bacterium]|nr:ParB/RepB/Spo0J family partition protein [Oscillospiraceae bacterium]
MAKKIGGLGRGLDALFQDNSVPAQGATELPMDEIFPDRNQPRKDFDDESLQELANSVKEHGVLQPILVRPIDNGYQIVAGERRWRAARLAGLTSVPVNIREMSDFDAMSIALVENLQREDLNPIEEAEGYRNLANATGWTQEQIAKRVGRSRPAVANALRLLSLPDEVIDLLRTGKLTTGHAKAILSIADDSTRVSVARMISEKGLTVREAEKLSQKGMTQERIPLPQAKDPVASEVELALKEALGVEVNVKYKAGQGTISLNFYSKEQLFEFANKLGGKE